MSPSLYEQCVGSLTSHIIYMRNVCATGQRFNGALPRRLDSLTIC